jgi:hypothetical protein
LQPVGSVLEVIVCFVFFDSNGVCAHASLRFVHSFKSFQTLANMKYPSYEYLFSNLPPPTFFFVVFFTDPAMKLTERLRFMRVPKKRMADMHPCDSEMQAFIKKFMDSGATSEENCQKEASALEEAIIQGH